MNSLQLALRSLKRQWYAGELRLLLLALVVAVASVSSVGFFTDRIEGIMVSQTGELLAADLVISGSEPIPQAWSEAARQARLRLAHTATFPSVVVAGEALQLAEVKAVSADYPLRGQLKTRTQLFDQDSIAEHGPGPGQVWLDPRLLSQLGIGTGQRVSLGDLQLPVTQLLAYEPDRGGDFFSIAPRLMFAYEDLAASGLIQPGSRVNYRLLLSGNPAAIAAFRRPLQAQIQQRGFRLLTAEEARPELKIALQRARSFLGLATIITTILAGVAIATAARRYAVRNQDNSAIMRCFGASSGDIRRLYLWQLTLLGIGGSLLAVLLGYLGHYPLLLQVQTLVQLPVLPAASLAPVVTGLVTGMLVIIGFALPPILALAQVPTLRVLRHDIVAPRPSTLAISLLAGLGVSLILWWQVESWKLVAIMLAGIALALAILLALVWMMLRLLLPLRRHFSIHVRFGLANLARRRSDTAAQVLAFGLALMVMLLLFVVRNDLLDGWRANLPADAPNTFLINIPNADVGPVRTTLQQAGIRSSELHPMVRGRLLSINDRAVNAIEFEDERSKRLATREFNLSWAEQLPGHNTLLAGKWWSANDPDPAQISLEQGLADTLGVKLGDRLGFNVAGTPFTVRISSLREVEWDSFQVNFFTLLPPQQLQQMPASWITSFYLPAAERDRLNPLLKRFPNITVIDVANLMQQVRDIMDKVALAIQFVFLFTLLAGLVLLYTAIQTTLDARMTEAAILKTLGGTAATLRTTQVAEFASIGLMASLLAIITAQAIAYLLGTQVFKLPYHFQPSLWWIGLGCGVIGITLAGLMGTRRINKQPPWSIIRR